MITQADLKKRLRYEPETGNFYWIGKPSKRLPAGAKAGTQINGYIRIHMGGKLYGAHRLAWLYTHGVHPTYQIDHINGNGLDNRIENLREATALENAQNKRKAQKNNSHGNLGITYDKAKKLWRARITLAGTRIYLGKFKTQEQASNAYLQAKAKLHPFSTLKSF